MENFRDGADKKCTQRICRLFFHKKAPEQRGQKTCQTGGNGTGYSCIAANPPERACNISLDTSDEACQYAGNRIEEQSGRQRTEIPHIEHHGPVVDAIMRGKNRTDSKCDANEYPQGSSHFSVF